MVHPLLAGSSLVAGEFSPPPCPRLSPSGTKSPLGGTPQVSSPQGGPSTMGFCLPPATQFLQPLCDPHLTPGVFHSGGPALSHSLGIGAEVSLPSNHPSPFSGVPLMVPPSPCSAGVCDLQIIAAAVHSAPHAAAPSVFSCFPQRLHLRPPCLPQPPAVSVPMSSLVADPPYLLPLETFSYDSTGNAR